MPIKDIINNEIILYTIQDIIHTGVLYCHSKNGKYIDDPTSINLWRIYDDAGDNEIYRWEGKNPALPLRVIDEIKKIINSLPSPKGRWLEEKWIDEEKFNHYLYKNLYPNVYLNSAYTNAVTEYNNAFAPILVQYAYNNNYMSIDMCYKNLHFLTIPFTENTDGKEIYSSDEWNDSMLKQKIHSLIECDRKHIVIINNMIKNIFEELTIEAQKRHIFVYNYHPYLGQCSYSIYDGMCRLLSEDLTNDNDYNLYWKVRNDIDNLCVQLMEKLGWVS